MPASAFQALPYRPEMAADWDAVVDAAHGGTVLHSRRFLDYHGPRFRDLSLVGVRSGETRISMVFPLAADLTDPELAVSHPGSSFGGVIALVRDPLHTRAFLKDAALWLRGQGLRRLLYRTTPAPLLRQPDDGLLPHLIQQGRVIQLDLWSILRLDPAVPERNYWQSEIRRAERKGLRAEPVETAADWTELHSTISGRLERKFGRPAVHSAAELIDLHRRLGAQSRGVLIRGPSDEVLAGLWFIDYGNGTLQNQYNGATDAGLRLGASSYGVALALEGAVTQRFAQFSFGRSTLEDGWSENRDLLRFKSRFGAGLASQFHIEVSLDRLLKSGL